MAAPSRTRSTGSGRLSSSAGLSSARSSFTSNSSAFASSSASSFSSHPSTFFHHHRSASPTRVNLVGSVPSAAASSVRFSLDRPTSPSRSHLLKRPITAPAVQRKTCMCSPTNHPGSFRCSLHKGFQIHSPNHHRAASSSSNRLNARRSAMTNSLVRIATVEGELVKRALAALIRPSSHQQRRRDGFRPRPSRLSAMSKAGDP